MLAEEVEEFNGFNLIVADLPSKSMVYITNRPKGESVRIQEVPPGLHVLSNAKLDSPWPKVRNKQYVQLTFINESMKAHFHL